MQDQNLKAVGLKVTTSRLKILQILKKAEPHHLSAEDVYQRLLAQNEPIGLATVYRVLTQFAAVDLVHRHHFESTAHSVYELNTGHHHDHLVCMTCGMVAEFYNDLIEQQQQCVAETQGFLIKDHVHTIYGFCQKCQTADA